MTDSLLLGAVAYDTKVVTIWSGFRHYLRERGLEFDYVLYSNYERQVEELVAGRLDVAWNSPLAWIRTARMSSLARPLVMRNTDRDLTSVIVVRNDSEIADSSGLVGKTVGVGAVDSPQSTLLPLNLLIHMDVIVKRFDIGSGLHGDHIGGERDAARALTDGTVDAACMSDANNVLFVQEGILPANGTRVLLQTPPYDHCNMSTTRVDSPLIAAFVQLLLGMDYADPEVRQLLDLEGLTQWLPGRTFGYEQLKAAVDTSQFYGRAGEVIANDYRP